MIPHRHCILPSVLVFALLRTPVTAEVTVPPIFSDHMVLQCSDHTPVWGTANPGEMVTVMFAGQTAQVTADTKGRWQVLLDLGSYLTEAEEMVIRGQNTLTIRDVVVGDVWLASGQSNMGWRLSLSDNGREEVAEGAGTLLREFHVEDATSDTPLDHLEGKWVKAEPGKTKDFSAVAYYFGKTIQQETGLPIGIIHASWGGTPIEAWMSEEALQRSPALKSLFEDTTLSVDEFPAKQAAFADSYGAWLKTNNREDQTAQPERFAAIDCNSSDWKTVTLPGSVNVELGSVWFRKELDLPKRCEGRDMSFDISDITGFESIYWNGVEVDGISYMEWPGSGGRRFYTIPGELIQEGKNVLAIRIFAPSETAAIKGSWFQLKGPARVNLKGKWKAKQAFALSELSDAEKATLPASFPEPMLHRYRPSYVYNGKIAPLVPYSIRGIIWYQGENNSGQAELYREAFPLMVEDWRAKWADPELPFYFCQLPNYKAKSVQPQESDWAELREAQATVLDLPNTEMAVIIDLGESDDIHPRNKAPVGRRLGHIALAHTYDQDIVVAGPRFAGMVKEGNHFRVQFSHTDGGLAVKNRSTTTDASGQTLQEGEPKLVGFAICGGDYEWTWAEAQIEGDSVVVWSESVPEPVAVRYAWADNPTANLTNGSGLPAAPFRTDKAQ